MKTTLEQVKQFHETYGQPIMESPDISNQEYNKLRVNLLQEELNELSTALAEGNIIETLDALTDLQYVLDGAYLTFGLHDLKYMAFDEVHQSNMSKLDENGKPIYRADGKVLKGPNYYKPDLTKFFD